MTPSSSNADSTHLDHLYDEQTGRIEVATHSGIFHGDDVFAVAALTTFAGSDQVHVVRTREPELLARATVRVDVGGGNDPVSGDFDHHQPGGGGVRSNGVPYASFGLIWKLLGESIAGSAEAAQMVDQRLVQQVDANDTGHQLFTSAAEGLQPAGVDNMISLFNPEWDEDYSSEALLSRFDDAVTLAGSIIAREVHHARAVVRAATLIDEALERDEAEDHRILVLRDSLPWQGQVVEHEPQVRFVVFPASDGTWGVQAVPRQLGAFGNRLDFPRDWGGLHDEALETATGVAGAVFCHTALFYVAAADQVSALHLARLALA